MIGDVADDLGATLPAAVGLIGVIYTARHASGWTRSQRRRKQLVEDLAIWEKLPSGRGRTQYRKLVDEKAVMIARDERLTTRLNWGVVCLRAVGIVFGLVFGLALVLIALRPGEGAWTRVQSTVIALTLVYMTSELITGIRGQFARRRQARDTIGTAAP